MEGDAFDSVRHLLTPSISIHALRVEGDCRPNSHHKKNANFYPRPPGGGRQLAGTLLPSETGISIHALRVEGDALGHGRALCAFQFLSTPSGWRATVPVHVLRDHVEISIHALRVEGD